MSSPLALLFACLSLVSNCMVSGLVPVTTTTTSMTPEPSSSTTVLPSSTTAWPSSTTTWPSSTTAWPSSTTAWPSSTTAWPSSTTAWASSTTAWPSSTTAWPSSTTVWTGSTTQWLSTTRGPQYSGRSAYIQCVADFKQYFRKSHLYIRNLRDRIKCHEDWIEHQDMRIKYLERLVSHLTRENDH